MGETCEKLINFHGHFQRTAGENQKEGRITERIRCGDPEGRFEG
jgi:hypothetical protein